MTHTPVNVSVPPYLITTDRAALDVAAVHRYLSEESYWAAGIPAVAVQQCFDYSFVIGILHTAETVGFARLVTDYTTFGYLADVYILEEHRGKGLSKAMMDVLLNLPWVQALRHLLLSTADAHGLYARYGFAPPAQPARLMQIVKPARYAVSTSPESAERTSSPATEA